MSERILTGFITFILVAFVGLLIYFNEHILIRIVNEHIYERVDILISDLERELKPYLLDGEKEKIGEILSYYKKFNGVKSIVVFDDVGKILLYSGDPVEVKFENFRGQSKSIRHVAEKGVYEAILSVESENRKIGWVALTFEPGRYVGVMKKVNLFIFSAIAVLIIIGFIVTVTILNRRIVEPISKVSEFVRDIARGVYNIQIEVPKHSSIRSFADNFNQMVRLIEEKERRLERQKSQFKLISEISRLGLEIKSVDELFKKVVFLIRQEFGFLSVVYYALDVPRKLKVKAVAGYLENRLSEDHAIEVGYGIPGSSVLLGDVIVINDVSKSPQFVSLYDAPIASEVAVPIRRKGKVIGVLDIASDKINVFTSEDVKIFRIIGETISLALERFDSMMENIRLIFKLETVYALTRELVLVRDVDKIFESAVKIIYSVLEKRDLVVEIYERVGDLLVMKSAYGNLKEPIPVRYSQLILEGVIGKAVREKNFIYVPEILLERDAKRFYETTSSEVVVPLMIKDKVIGAINCESGVVNAFDDVDILILRTIADMLSIAVHNARMYRTVLESENKYRTIFESSSEAIFRMSLDGKFIDVNPAFVEIFGFSLEDEVNFYQLFISNEAAKKFKEEILLHERVSDFSAKLKNKGGEVLSVKISMSKFVGSDGEVYCDGIIVNLTEYLKAIEKAYEAERLRGLIQIAGGIAHEFNNVFASILGSAQLIKMRVPQGEKIYHWADIIERSTVRGAELVKKLVGYARGGKFRISNVNLNEMITGLLKKVKIEDKILIKVEFDPRLPEVMCDYEQIEQVLLNIIQNAIEAMRDEGTLSIGTEFRYFDKTEVKDPDFVPGEYVRISISDTGIGMTEDIMKQIFEPFFTTKRELGKSGLGLSMAYGVIKNHNGFISVSSTPGKGSRFDIFLPVQRIEREQKRIEKWGIQS
jgi:PAS domain S-box-containing protein